MISDNKFQFMMFLLGGEPPKFTATDTLYTGGGWAHLPKPILFSLLKHLDLRTDAPRLRAVCSTWRSALPAKYIPRQPLAFDDAPKLPVSDLPVIIFSYKFYIISSLESDSPWIIQVEDLTLPGSNKFTLHNPVYPRGRKYFESDPPVTGRINLLDFNVTELASTFSLYGGPTRAGARLKTLSGKIVGGWDFNSEYLFAILAIARDATNGKSALLYLKIGQMRWTAIEEMRPVSGDKKKDESVLRDFDVADIALYDGEFYAFDYATWQVAVIDPSDHKFHESPTVEFIDGPEVEYMDIGGMKLVNVDGHLYSLKGVNFVASGNGLYLLLEVSGGDIEGSMIVFELDEDEFEWVRVSSIGEQVFFIGSDVAFSVSAEVVPRWKAGSVCLFKRSMAMLEGNVEAELDGIGNVSYPKYWKWFRMFNVEEEEKGIVSFAELDREVYTGVFFPPPCWVKWSCPRLGDVAVEFGNLRMSDEGEDDASAAAATEGKCLVLEEVE